MVLEGVLVDVLNRFLGPYVKNLDASQLRVGIWGGDVLLENLELKENALADFDLPVRVFGGFLDRLRLKIPWKRLYSDPVVVEVEGVYVVAGPASAAKYDPDKDAKERKERKDRQLKKVEQAKKKAAEAKQDKKDQAAPGFAEKLMTQIVKNVQVTVKNIHIKYEDAISDRDFPFACGVSLDSLLLLSTDSNYKVGVAEADTTSSLIYKLVKLSCLAAYWNSNTQLLGPNLPPGWKEMLKASIARPGGSTAKGYHYIVHPISAQSHIQLCTRPGSDMEIPQALITLVLQEVALALGKQQFRNIVCLVESFDRMSVNQKFLKYRPEVGVAEGAGQWWRYAITAILEEDVKRRLRMWSWSHIKRHRAQCKAYTKAYTEKLLAKSVSTQLKTTLENLETELDVFNITVCRELAETEARRAKELAQEQAESGGWWGWTSGWLGGGGGGGGGGEAPKPLTDEELEAEKMKLYDSIGYSEKGLAASFHPKYVAHRVEFKLGKVALTLCDEIGTVATVETTGVCAGVTNRPASGNISVTAAIEGLRVTGQPVEERDGGTEEEGPEMVKVLRREVDVAEPLLSVNFDLNPLDTVMKIDQRIRATLHPIQVTYDASTVDSVIGMFLLPQDVHLQKLSAAATSTLKELRTQSRAGLEHAISKRKLLDVDITLNSPCIVVPENGVMSSSAALIVADLGSLHVTSDMKHHIPSVRDASLTTLQEAFYDRFKLTLHSFQLIVAGPSDDWRAARAASHTPLHLVAPACLELELWKSLLPNDTELPSFKVSGKLPSLTFDLSDWKIVQVLKLVKSLPLPPPSLANKPKSSNYKFELIEDEPVRMEASTIVESLQDSAILSSSSLTTASREKEEEEEEVDSDEFFTASEGEDEDEEDQAVTRGEKARKKLTAGGGDGMTEGGGGGEGNGGTSEVVASSTQLDLKFTIPEIAVHFSVHKESASGEEGGGAGGGEEALRMVLTVSSVAVSVLQRSWDLTVATSVQTVAVTDHFSQGLSSDPLYFLCTEPSPGDHNFLQVHYSKYDRTAPHYSTVLDSTHQTIVASVAPIRLTLLRESLADLLRTARDITSSISASEASDQVDHQLSSFVKQTSQVAFAAEKNISHPPSPSLLPGEKDLCVMAEVGGMEVILCDCHGDIACAYVKGLKADIDMYQERIEVKASVEDIKLVDKESVSFHPDVIVRVDEAKDFLTAKVIVHKDAKKEGQYRSLESADLTVEACVQRLRVVLVLHFVESVKEYATDLVSQLKLEQSTIDSAKEVAAKGATRTAETLRDQGSSRLRLSIKVQAPFLVLPLSATSQSALVADLGLLKVNNCFRLADESDLVPEGEGGGEGGDRRGGAECFTSPSGAPAVVDHMTICVSSVQLGRVDNLHHQGVLPSDMDHVMLKPLEFEGYVDRRLSDWCSAIPAVSVSAELGAVEVHFSPADYHAAITIVDSINSSNESKSNKAVHADIKEIEEAVHTRETKEKDVARMQDETTEETGHGSFSSLIRVNATVRAISLLLHSSEGSLATVNITGVAAQVHLLSSEIRVVAGVTAIQVTDASKDTEYPKIMSSAESTKAVQATVVVYPTATKGAGCLDTTKCDMSIEVSVGQLRIVALVRFVNQLVRFARQLNLNQRTIETAKKSAQESASAAVSAVQEMHHIGKRMRLDVDIQAPEIVIPVSSLSLEMLVADLGHLKLGNTFHLHPSEPRALFETYNIQLTSLQLYRSLGASEGEGEGREEWSMACRRALLEPVSASVDMKHNLSAAWFNGIPTIDVMVHLDAIKLVASGDDIETVCGIINGNLKEGVDTDSDEEELDEEELKDDEYSEDTALEDASTQLPAANSGGDVDREGQIDEEDYLTLRVVMELVSVTAHLYKKGPALSCDDPSTCTRDQKFSLATLSLDLLKASASIHNSASINAAVSMAAITLDDMRVEKAGKITRLIDRLPNDAASPQAMHADVVMTKEDGLTVAACVDSMLVLFDLVFIKTLVSFMLTSLEPVRGRDAVDSETDQNELETKPLESRKVLRRVSESHSKSHSETTAVAVERESTKIQLRVNVSRPCVALLEDACHENSQALTLGTELSFQFIQSHGNTNMSATVQQLHIATTTYQSLQSCAQKVLSLNQPITASVDALQGSSTFIRVCIPSMSIVLSPTTVRLILNVTQSLKPEKSEEEEIDPTSPRDLWTTMPINRQKWYLQPLKAKVASVESSVDRVDPKKEGPTIQELLDLEMKEIKLIVEKEDSSSITRHSSVMSITMGTSTTNAFTLKAENWSKQLSASATLSIVASYFNQRVNSWEPLLEPLVEQVTEKYNPWTLNAKVDKSPISSSSTPTYSEDLPPEMVVKVSSEDALQFTVSKSCLGLLLELFQAYTEKQKEPVEEVDTAALLPETADIAYMIVNRLGTTVLVTPKDNLKAHGAYNPKLRPGSRLPLHPTDAQQRAKPGELIHRENQFTRRINIVNIKMDNYHSVNIALGGGERCYYALRPSNPQQSDRLEGIVVSIERQSQGEVPLVTLRAPLQIINHLNIEVDIYWDQSSSPKSLPSRRVVSIASKGTVAIPLANATSGALFIKPDHPKTRMSKEPVMWSGKVDQLINCSTMKLKRDAEGAANFNPALMESKPFFIYVKLVEEHYSRRISFPLTDRPHHILHLHFPLFVHNLLCVPLKLSIMSVGGTEELLIGPGEESCVYYADIRTKQGYSVKLSDEESGEMLVGLFEVGPKTPETVSFKVTGKRKMMILSLRKEHKGAVNLSIYSPYWMVNKSGLALEYQGKGSEELTVHPPHITRVLFPNKEARVRLLMDGDYSEWSSWFPLDAVGTEGVFTCKLPSKQEEYQMGTKVELSRFGITRIITITPFYMVFNRTRDCVSFAEMGDSGLGKVHGVESRKLVPFWPCSHSGRMTCAVNDTSMVHSSMPFKYTETQSLLLRIHSEIPALEVEIQITGSANIITFLPYYRGAVPVQMINDTAIAIQFHQNSSNVHNVYVLPPDQSLMYTWDDPLSNREIITKNLVQPQRSQSFQFSVQDGFGELTISKHSQSGSHGGAKTTPDHLSPTIQEEEGRDETDDKDDDSVFERDIVPSVGPDSSAAAVKEDPRHSPRIAKSFKTVHQFVRSTKRITSSLIKRVTKTSISQSFYWVSFQDGLQRVVLFTADKQIQDHVLSDNGTERAHLQITLSLYGLGLSLVNDEMGTEVAYIVMPPSDAMWESERKGGRWRRVQGQLNDKLEVAHEAYLGSSSSSSTEPCAQLPDSEYKVDFAHSYLIDKSDNKVSIRRRHFEGLWTRLSLSKHLTTVEARINEIQVDNALPFALHPTILYAYPQPPTIAAKYEPKAFVECCCIFRLTEQSNVNEIQYVQVLIQEVGVNFDLGFVLALINLLDKLPSTTTEAMLLSEDVSHTELPLERSKVAQVTAASTRNYFKYLHLSPLQIHLNVSLEESGGIEKASEDMTRRNPLLEGFLNFIGSFASLIGRAKDAELKLGYFQLENVTLTQRALRDRITKHYIQQGVYQIYTLVLGLELLGNPVGFVRGLKDGTVSLFYKPIEGAVLGPGEFFEGLSLGSRQFVGGTIGGLSGAVGKMTGVLGDTVAKLTFDNEFQGRRSKGSGSVGQGLEGMVKGVFEGFTGVVVQPIRGARQGGVLGFFKGTGRGMLGLVLRPTGGIIDLTSATLNAVQKKTRVGDQEVLQIRFPRYIGPEKIIYPYSPHKAAGFGVFLAFDSGDLVRTELYFDHMELVESPLKILLITTNRFMIIKRIDILDKWDDEECVSFKEVSQAATVREDGVLVRVVDERSGLTGLVTGFFGQGKKKSSDVTTKVVKLDIKEPPTAKRAASLINQALEDYKTTQQLDTQ